jgi:hypothetical protein
MKGGMQKAKRQESLWHINVVIWRHIAWKKNFLSLAGIEIRILCAPAHYPARKKDVKM